jgi:arylsulfatase A-like enzyme
MMLIRITFAAVFLCCSGILPLVCNVASAASVSKPNIVLIVADDLGFGDLGCYGAKRIKTPNVDRLASQGARFTAAYAPSSTCTPTRYSILTGEYAWRQPVKKTGILDGDAPLCIEPGRVTLPAMLQNAGYKTGVVGKWHLGLGDGQTPVDFNNEIKPGPLEIGFDYCFIIPATVDRVPSVWIENHKVVGLNPADPIVVSYLTNISEEPTGIERPDLLKQGADKQHSGTIINGISRIGFMKGGQSARFKDEELTSTVVQKSVAFLERHRGERFFLSVGLFEPHVPRVAEPPFVNTSECGIRGDVVQQLDWATGEILRTLDRLQLADDTLVIFTSDNGPVLFDGYFDRSIENANGHQPAGGLHGWKYLVYEGGCRVPLIARWPARIKPSLNKQMFSLVDLVATLGTISGGKVPSSASDSMDLSRVLLSRSKKNLRDHTILHGLSDALAIRQGDWKFIPANAKGPVSGMGRGANPADSRFAESRIETPLLFNLKDDPAETKNVIAANPKVAAKLKKRLAEVTGRAND